MERTLSFNSIDIKLNLDMGVGIGGDKWPAAELFSYHVTCKRNKSSFNNLFRNKRIVELGSGTGLCGILVAKHFESSEVMITDLPSHIDHIKCNVNLNSPFKASCSVDELDWTTYSGSLGKFDVILALECVYHTSLYQPLVDTMIQLSSENSLIILGMTRQFLSSKFFDILKSNGFTVRLVPITPVVDSPASPAGVEFISTNMSGETGLLFCKRSPP